MSSLMAGWVARKKKAERRKSPRATLQLCEPHLEAMRRIIGLDPRKADARDRRLARVLATLTERADVVLVRDVEEANELGAPFLAAADRIERVARLG